MTPKIGNSVLTLAELIFEAKKDVFAIGGYPPKYLLSAKTALKAASKRGVHASAPARTWVASTIARVKIGEARAISSEVSWPSRSASTPSSEEAISGAANT